MDEQDSHCFYLLSIETSAKGSVLVESAEKEGTLEHDSILVL